MLRKDARDHLHALCPMRRLLLARLDVDLFQSVGRGLHQAEADALAAPAQLRQPPGLPLLFAALRDGDVDDVALRLAQQPQRQSADDDFIIRVRRENQNLRRLGWNLWSRQRPERAERITPALFSEAGVFGGEVLIGVHCRSGLRRENRE